MCGRAFARPSRAARPRGGSARAHDPGGTLPLNKGDHVSLIGNALAEGMQHDGWLEALIQRRFPDSQLVFRNLGFSGDELARRQRSEGFGSPDDWLKKNETDVVLAFFGYGESFDTKKGLDGFKKDLDAFIAHTLGQKYNGESAPKLVLVSPIAFEDLDDDDLPDADAMDRQLEPFAKAMAEAAKAHQGVYFVDLFGPTKDKYESSVAPLTTNGHYLNSAGNRFVAETIVAALFPGESASGSDEARLEKIRRAVVDKNFYFFNRYRTTDGYNVYGGRSSLAYTDGITNRQVMDREMEILDVMTANRDRRVWAVAQGGDLQVDDSNTPPFIPVKTNLPGPLPGGEHEFLGGEEAIAKMTVADGLEVQLVASEEQFPDLINPVQMAFDTKDRLWVATWPTYPHWTPKTPQNDKLLILEDTDRDGKADRSKVFADNLSCPTGFEFWNGGVIVAMAPDLLFLKDTDGDDVADVRVRILHGLDSADSHHTANSFVLAPDGALYFQEGVFHQSQIESNDGVHRNHNACVWRFEPRTGKVERYVPFDFANPHGHAFTRWGQDIIHDGTGADPFHAVLFSGYLPFPLKHSRPPKLYNQRTRPCPATEVLASRHFPDEFQGNLLVENVIGFQGILRYRLEDAGSSLMGVEVEPILSSSDPKFRPVDIEVGPDGALYFTDWQNPIIGHMQHHIRDPNRDKTHGRVYRVVAKGRDLLTPPEIAGQSIPALLDLLKTPEDRVRYRTRIELSGRETEDVVRAANDWVEALDENDPEYAHNLLEALWVFQQHNVVNERLLGRVLALKEPRARAAAVRVLVGWRDRLDGPVPTLAKLAADEDPRVRLEVVRAASFFDDPAVQEIPFLTLEHPTDAFLDFTREETLKALDQVGK
jgi:glucose/arabinose dehydrogenase